MTMSPTALRTVIVRFTMDQPIMTPLRMRWDRTALRTAALAFSSSGLPKRLHW